MADYSYLGKTEPEWVKAARAAKAAQPAALAAQAAAPGEGLEAPDQGQEGPEAPSREQQAGPEGLEEPEVLRAMAATRAEAEARKKARPWMGAIEVVDPVMRGVSAITGMHSPGAAELLRTAEAALGWGRTDEALARLQARDASLTEDEIVRRFADAADGEGRPTDREPLLLDQDALLVAKLATERRYGIPVDNPLDAPRILKEQMAVDSLKTQYREKAKAAGATTTIVNLHVHDLTNPVGGDFTKTIEKVDGLEEMAKYDSGSLEGLANSIRNWPPDVQAALGGKQGQVDVPVTVVPGAGAMVDMSKLRRALRINFDGDERRVEEVIRQLQTTNPSPFYIQDAEKLNEQLLAGTTGAQKFMRAASLYDIGVYANYERLTGGDADEKFAAATAPIAAMIYPESYRAYYAGEQGTYEAEGTFGSVMRSIDPLNTISAAMVVGSWGTPEHLELLRSGLWDYTTHVEDMVNAELGGYNPLKYMKSALTSAGMDENKATGIVGVPFMLTGIILSPDPLPIAATPVKGAVKGAKEAVVASRMAGKADALEKMALAVEGMDSFTDLGRALNKETDHVTSAHIRHAVLDSLNASSELEVQDILRSAAAKRKSLLDSAAESAKLMSEAHSEKLQLDVDKMMGELDLDVARRLEESAKSTLDNMVSVSPAKSTVNGEEAAKAVIEATKEMGRINGEMKKLADEFPEAYQELVSAAGTSRAAHARYPIVAAQLDDLVAAKRAAQASWREAQPSAALHVAKQRLAAATKSRAAIEARTAGLSARARAQAADAATKSKHAAKKAEAATEMAASDVDAASAVSSAHERALAAASSELKNAVAIEEEAVQAFKAASDAVGAKAMTGRSAVNQVAKITSKLTEIDRELASLRVNYPEAVEAFAAGAARSKAARSEFPKLAKEFDRLNSLKAVAEARLQQAQATAAALDAKAKLAKAVSDRLKLEKSLKKMEVDSTRLTKKVDKHAAAAAAKRMAAEGLLSRQKAYEAWRTIAASELRRTAKELRSWKNFKHVEFRDEATVTLASYSKHLTDSGKLDAQRWLADLEDHYGRAVVDAFRESFNAKGKPAELLENIIGGRRFLDLSNSNRLTLEELEIRLVEFANTNATQFAGHEGGLVTDKVLGRGMRLNAVKWQDMIASRYGREALDAYLSSHSNSPGGQVILWLRAAKAGRHEVITPEMLKILRAAEHTISGGNVGLERASKLVKAWSDPAAQAVSRSLIERQVGMARGFLAKFDPMDSRYPGVSKAMQETMRTMFELRARMKDEIHDIATRSGLGLPEGVTRYFDSTESMRLRNGVSVANTGHVTLWHRAKSALTDIDSESGLEIVNDLLEKAWVPPGREILPDELARLREALNSSLKSDTFEEFMDKMQRNTAAIFGDVEDVGRAFSISAQGIIHAALSTRLAEATARITNGSLAPEMVERINRVVLGSTTGVPTVPKEAMKQADDLWRVLERLGLRASISQSPYASKRAGQSAHKLVEMAADSTGARSFIPRNLVDEFNSDLNGFIKTVDKYSQGSRDLADSAGVRAAWRLYGLHRANIVLGLLVPKPTHWANTFFGDFSQIWQAHGLRTAARVTWNTLPTYMPMGTRLQDLYTRSVRQFGGKPVLGSAFNAIMNGNLNDFWTMTDERALTTLLVDKHGRSVTVDMLRRECKEAGILETFVNAALRDEMDRASAKLSSQYKNRLLRDLKAWQDAIEGHMVAIQQRQRVALYLDLRLNRGFTAKEAATSTVNAMYDWRHGLGKFEQQFILTRLAPFYRFYRLAVRQAWQAMIEPFVMPAEDVLRKSLLGRTQLARVRQQYQLAHAIPSWVSQFGTEEEYDAYTEIENSQHPEWARGRMTFMVPISPEDRQHYIDNYGAFYTHSMYTTPASTPLDIMGNMIEFGVGAVAAAYSATGGVENMGVKRPADIAESMIESGGSPLANWVQEMLRDAAAVALDEKSENNVGKWSIKEGDRALLDVVAGLGPAGQSLYTVDQKGRPRVNPATKIMLEMLSPSGVRQALRAMDSTGGEADATRFVERLGRFTGVLSRYNTNPELAAEYESRRIEIAAKKELKGVQESWRR